MSRAARLAAATWLVSFVTVYSWAYGPANFLQLCDVAVILTCLGIMQGSALVVSSQAVSSFVIDTVWSLDVLWRLLTGHHLVGGTGYMWDTRWPLWLRLMSLFHVVWPPLLVAALRRMGYDARALALQSAVAAVFLVASRLVLPAENINFAHRDPFWHRSWGPAPVHLAVTFGVLVGVIYWPTHAVLRRLWGRNPAG